ncbi:alpha/beta hydrolase [Hydrogenophaga sp.]|uniref:alpha/beta hydrolase n=1 Tax=Hydrogenophaga sp. TaxID=1904254 RepID=UPI0027184964|nr:alpha/beta hydrolase-fold protein [Hydrogenophaga sp.]MDO9436927.1 alpha/beta hydrolase-fold protein [Hydrogenophaga sp.]
MMPTHIPHHLPRRRLLLALAAGTALAGCASTPKPMTSDLTALPLPPINQDLSAYALTRPVGPTVADSPSPHYRFERFSLDSADGKRHYRVQLAIPKAAPPRAGYPLLVMLDGNAAFGSLTDEQLTLLATRDRPLAIATLGYETNLGVDVDARSFDYTPAVPGENPTWDDQARNRLGGGADLFLDLLEQKMLPEIRRRVPSDPARTTLWGHSYGGLLTLYTLFTRPQLFPRYAAADPSLWWHDGFILDLEAAAKPLPRRTELLMLAGSAGLEVQNETRALRPGLDPAVVLAARERRRAVPPDATPRLAERQGERRGLTMTWKPFPGVSHGPMRPTSIPPTLEFAAR